MHVALYLFLHRQSWGNLYQGRETGCSSRSSSSNSLDWKDRAAKIGRMTENYEKLWKRDYFDKISDFEHTASKTATLFNCTPFAQLAKPSLETKPERIFVTSEKMFVSWLVGFSIVEHQCI